MSEKKLQTLASLFCGCGGGDIGFIQAGFRVIKAYDLDPIAVDLYYKNVGRHIVKKDLSSPIGLDAIRGVDVLLASPPCQGFSTIGKRRLDDERNKLLMSSVEIIAHAKPKLAIIENVKGAVSGEHLQLWQEAESYLRTRGFEVRTEQFKTYDFGVPQSRCRVVMVAVPLGKPLPELLPQNKKSLKTLEDVLPKKDEENLLNHEPKFLVELSQEWLIAQAIKQGQKLCDVRSGTRAVHSWDIPEAFGRVSYQERQALETILRLRRQKRRRDYGDADPVEESLLYETLPNVWCRHIREKLLAENYIRIVNGDIDLRRTFNGKYRRPSPNGPSPTVDTHFGSPRSVLHPQEHRGFTIREAARIQSFPDSYDFRGSQADMYRVIGNAIPPHISKVIGENLLHRY